MPSNRNFSIRMMQNRTWLSGKTCHPLKQENSNFYVATIFNGKMYPNKPPQNPLTSATSLFISTSRM